MVNKIFLSLVVIFTLGSIKVFSVPLSFDEYFLKRVIFYCHVEDEEKLAYYEEDEKMALIELWNMNPKSHTTLQKDALKCAPPQVQLERDINP